MSTFSLQLQVDAAADSKVLPPVRRLTLEAGSVSDVLRGGPGGVWDDALAISEVSWHVQAGDWANGWPRLTDDRVVRRAAESREHVRVAPVKDDAIRRQFEPYRGPRAPTGSAAVGGAASTRVADTFDPDALFEGGTASGGVASTPARAGFAPSRVTGWLDEHADFFKKLSVVPKDD